VHILHDYRSKPHDEPYRMSAATGRGILVAALTTILGFSTLMISRHQGMRSLGFALSLGVTCCMIAALFVLPAVLCLRDRRANRQQQAPPVEMRRAA
jgi:predicted RND superfamily exporter protein